MSDCVVATRHGNGGWQAGIGMRGMSVQCVAVDPLKPERVYCGTFGQGLWRSEDVGATWQRAGGGIPHPDVRSIAVSTLERFGGLCVPGAVCF